MRERFIPRVLEATPDSLFDFSGKNLDPHKIWMMFKREAGGHGERSVAGPIEWRSGMQSRRSKKNRCFSCSRYGTASQSQDLRLRRRRLLLPGQDHQKLKDEMKSYIDRGYTVVKKKIGGASLDEDLRRIDSISVSSRSAAACRRSRCRRSRAVPRSLLQYDLFWYEEPGDPLDFELQATLRNYYKNPMATGRTCSRCRTRAT